MLGYPPHPDDVAVGQSPAWVVGTTGVMSSRLSTAVANSKRTLKVNITTLLLGLSDS